MNKFNAMIVGLMVLGAINLSGAELQCKGEDKTPIPEILANPQHACNQIKEMVDRKDTGFSEESNNQLIDLCMCSLVPRKTIWATVSWPYFDKGVDQVYRAAVESRVAYNHHKEGSLGWLNNFFANIARYEKEVPHTYISRVRDSLYKEFSQTFGSVDEPEAREMGESWLAETCKLMDKSFKPIWAYFEAAAKLAQKPDFAYAMAAQDRNLFKIAVVYRTCIYPNMVKQ